MKKLLVLLNVLAFCFVFISSAISAEISSVQGGGLWSNPNSWVGGKIPNSDDNVIINGKITVDIAFTCNRITIPANTFLVINTKDDAHCLCKYLMISGSLIIEEKSEITVKTTIEKDDSAFIMNKGVINLLGEE
jgi:hypothetical protein